MVVGKLLETLIAMLCLLCARRAGALLMKYSWSKTANGSSVTSVSRGMKALVVPRSGWSVGGGVVSCCGCCCCMLDRYRATFFLAISPFIRSSTPLSVLPLRLVAALCLVAFLSCLKGQPGLWHGQLISDTSSRRMLSSYRSCVVSSQNSRDSVDDFLLEIVSSFVSSAET